MYLSHFNLNAYPFKITPDLAFFYHKESRDFALQNLKLAIDRGEGIIKVIGEVGSGKTTLLRLLAKSLPLGFKVIYLSSPNISSKDLLFFLCEELGLKVGKDFAKQQLLRLLQSVLIELHTKNRKVLILIDEAQVAPIDTLEELRLLSNLETEKDKLLHLILFGQIEFDITLESVEAKPLLARISTSIYLNDFTWNEVRSYLNYRMRIAGYQGEDFFTNKDAKKIYKLSSGLPRRINIIADKLLMSAYSHNRMKLKPVDYQVLDEFSGSGKGKFFISILILIIMVVLLYWGSKYFISTNLLSGNLDKVQQENQPEEKVINLVSDDFYTILVYSGSLMGFNAKLRANPELKNFIAAEKTILRLNEDKTSVSIFYGSMSTIQDAEEIIMLEDVLINWPQAKVVSMQGLND